MILLGLSSVEVFIGISYSIRFLFENSSTQDNTIKFRDAFVAQWMLQARRSQLNRKFMVLQQGSITILRYERNFNELSNFGSSLIDTPLKKNEKFVGRMRVNFQERLTGHLHSPFIALLVIATSFKNLDLKKGPAAKAQMAQSASSNPGKREMNFHQQKKNMVNKGGVGYSQKRPTDLSNITYFEYDQKGHFSNQCPAT